MSRPANVGPGAGNWYSSLVNDTARPAPPVIATAEASRPLSGPTEHDSPSTPSTATARRSPPTPGSTTPSTTPAGRYCAARANASDPARTSWGGISWQMSSTVTCGATRRITALHTPTNSSVSPDADRNEMVSKRGTAPPTYLARGVVAAGEVAVDVVLPHPVRL